MSTRGKINASVALNEKPSYALNMQPAQSQLNREAGVFILSLSLFLIAVVVVRGIVPRCGSSVFGVWLGAR
ncbi:MAG: hypothetical protein E7K57_06020, partial [Corynebacterium sp.]|nr:hypothetical protein [Corynebacterium sp.]